MSSSTVVRMLAICKYRYQDQAKKHIMAAINQYRNLEPKQEMFTFPNGAHQELFTLAGTIPVNYRGTTYNIPVAIYFPQDYPYSPPMCYVRPTPDMMVKPARHVDTSGRVYLPYLTDWKNDTSDLLALIQVMIIVFSENPPVYQKPKNQPFVTPPNTATSDNCPYPRQPGTPTSGYITLPACSPGSHYQQPGFPTRPPTSTPGYPTPPTSGYPSYPSYPGYPTAGTGFPQPPQPPASSGTTPYPSYPSYPTPVSPTSTSGSSSPYSTGTVTSEHIKASVLSAVEDKIRTRLREKVAQKEAEIEVLKNTQQELERGTRTLDTIISNCEKEAAELLDAKSHMEKLDSHYQSLILKYKDSEETPDIDEAFGPTEPVYKQLMDCYAEENAISDALYYLGEGLQKGVIDLDTYLKKVRDKSKDQFKARYLMQKCRERAGLPY